MSKVEQTYAMFRKSPFLRHVRRAHLRRMNVEIANGVAITWTQSKRATRLGGFRIPANAVVLHHIINEAPGNGAATEAFVLFAQERGCDICLAVRRENSAAVKFFEKMEMERVGTTKWGTVDGYIYKLRSVHRA